MTAALGRRVAPAMVMVGGFIYLLRATANQWFFYDDWDFIKESSGSLRWAPFTPHNGHPSLLPKLLYDALYRTVGLHRYWPYLVFLLLAHVAVAELTRRVLLRAGAGPWVALAVALLVLLLGAGWQNIIWAFQVGFVGALACGLGAMLLVDSDRPERRYRVGVAALLVVGLQMSSIGAVMLVAVAVWMVLRGRLRRDWPLLAIPTVLYAIWLFVERGSLGSRGSLRTSLPRLPGVIWDGISGAFSTLVSFAWLGALLGILLLVLLAGHLIRDRRAMALPIALAVAAVAFLALVALERNANGVYEVTASRYVYVVAVLSLPLLVSGLLRVGRGAAAPAVAALAGLGILAMAGYNIHVLRDQLDFWSAVKQGQRTRVLATAVLVRQGDVPIADTPDPVGMPQLQYQDIVRFVSQGSLPGTAGITPGDTLSAREFLDIGLTIEPRTVAAAGCVSVTGGGALPVQLEVPFDGPTTFRLQHLRSLDVQLVDRADRTQQAAPRHVDVPAGATVWVTTRLTGFDAVLSVDRGAELCGAQPRLGSGQAISLTPLMPSAESG